MTRATGTTSKLAAAFLALEDLQWLERTVVGKVSRRPALPSVLTENGFIQSILKEAKDLKREVKSALSAKALREKLLASSNIDWRSASPSARKRAIVSMSKLLEGLPTDFARGVRAVLDTEAKRVVQDTHQRLGAKYDQLSVDPVFALKNERAIAALNESTSIFFKPEYEQQASRFRSRAQKTMAKGLEDGLGTREIGAKLREEFNGAGLHDAYWDTVAAVHVNRARSFSSMATYAENGVTQYEVVAVEDERTTHVCRMMNGTILSVESALDAFDSFEDAKNLDQVRDKIAPFMRLQGDQIVTRGGAQIGSRNDNGTYSKVAPDKMNEKGINTPPYHFRCRTTVIPVLDSAAVIPAPKKVTSADVPPEKKPKKPRQRAPKEPTLTPQRPGPDPVAAATTEKGRRDAVVKQVKDGLGFVPGTMSTTAKQTDLIGEGWYRNEPKAKAASKELNDALAAAFLDRGKGIVASNPTLQKAWNDALGSRKSGGLVAMSRRNHAVDQMLAKTKRLGIEAIPEKQREKRRQKFIDEVLKKARRGRKQGGRFVPYRGAKGKLSSFEIDDLTAWAGEFFDAWGVVAEGALSRNKRIIKSTGRAHNSQHNEYFSYPNRSTFHHEFGHSIEHHVNSPRGGKKGTNRDPDEQGSFWRQRLEHRDPNPARRLSELTGNSAYDSWEVSKKDKWADAYTGKLYSRGSTEVVAMMSEAFGGNLGRWRSQFQEDPDALLEFLGWMESVINGETTRQARERAERRAARKKPKKPKGS